LILHEQTEGVHIITTAIKERQLKTDGNTSKTTTVTRYKIYVDEEVNKEINVKSMFGMG